MPESKDETTARLTRERDEARKTAEHYLEAWTQAKARLVGMDTLVEKSWHVLLEAEGGEATDGSLVSLREVLEQVEQEKR